MMTARTGSTPTPFGFVGQGGYQTDADTGLMLVGHRYYDASTGRFLSADPAKAGTNWYDYCDNNPLNRADPSGYNPGYSFGNYNPGGTNGQTTGFGFNGTTEGNPGFGLNNGVNQPIKFSGTVKLPTGGTIVGTITPPQGDQPPGSPIGTTGAGPGMGTITATVPIGRIGSVGLLGSLGGSGKLDGSATGSSFGGGFQAGRIGVIFQGGSTTTNTGKTTTSKTGTISYTPGGPGDWTVSLTGTTAQGGAAQLMAGRSF